MLFALLFLINIKVKKYTKKHCNSLSYIIIYHNKEKITGILSPQGCYA